MSILKRYVFKQFLQIYALTLGGLVGIFVIIDGFERLDEFVIRSAPVSHFFLYYLYKIPFILFFMAPQSVLLATVITLAALSRNNEFTAMKACGISVTRITLPILSSSVIIALLVVTLNEFVTPVTSARMNYILNVQVRLAVDQTKEVRNQIWHRSRNGSIWNIDTYDPVRSFMEGVSIYYYDEDSVIRRRLDAEKALWNGQQWEFMNGTLRFFKPDGVNQARQFEKEIFPTLETPDDFKKIQKRLEEMSGRDMYREILELESKGIDASKKWVDLNHKLAYPFLAVVLALVGIPLSLRTSRQGGLLFSIAMSLVLGFGFSFIYAFSISLGHGGTLHPVLAAWGPSLLFTCIGFYLLLTLDSEKLLPF